MIRRAEERGEIGPGDTLIEATRKHRHCAGHGRCHPGLPHGADHARGSVGGAGADHEGLWRRAHPHAQERRHGIRTRPGRPDGGAGQGVVLDQFANADNPRIHYETTGPELWGADRGAHHPFRERHGTTGTITGVARFLREKNPGAHHRCPAAGGLAFPASAVAEQYLPKIYQPNLVDELVLVSQDDAEDMARRLGARGGHLWRYLRRRRLLGGAADRGAGAERHHCLRGLRPGRSLPVHRRLSRLERAPHHAIPDPLCSHCATALAPIVTMGTAAKERLRCPACGWTHWNNPTPVLAAIVEVDGRILLARNALWPAKMFA